MTIRLLLFAPIILISGMFVLGAFHIISTPDLGSATNGTLFIGITAIYAAAVALLYRMGMGRITQLEKIGLTDTLCHLPNRRALHAEVQDNLAKGHDVAIGLLDLDGFKLVNDLYGHAVGDKLIQQMARLIDNCAGEEASAFRLGGDEFALSVAGDNADAVIEQIAARLILELARPREIDGRKIPIGVSIGLASTIANFPKDDLQQDGSAPENDTGQSDAEQIDAAETDQPADNHRQTNQPDSSELLRRADIAMYISKRNGKNRLTWFITEFDSTIATTLELADELRDALENDGFELLYQPIVKAGNGQITAVEALLRWRRGGAEDDAPVKPLNRIADQNFPARTHIAPDEFLPIAEEAGLIDAIDLFVIRKACCEALEWDDVRLSVNISAAQLLNSQFPARLEIILQETGFPPERLELETTEHWLVRDPKLTATNLAEIRKLGVSVALDDFGQGYVAVHFLAPFQLQTLKLDPTLVHKSAGSDSSRVVALANISMAQALHMRVTAEGVESEEQAAILRAAGCDEMQGFYFYQPMTPAQFADELAFDSANRPNKILYQSNRLSKKRKKLTRNQAYEGQAVEGEDQDRFTGPGLANGNYSVGNVSTQNIEKGSA